MIYIIRRNTINYIIGGYSEKIYGTYEDNFF